jgi:hypothetical protein
MFFNAFPRFDYNVPALKLRTRVLKQRTMLRLKFVRDLAATRPNLARAIPHEDDARLEQGEYEVHHLKS